MNTQVVIVGAGIVGAACALQLAEAGLAPLVIEAGSPGTGVTAEGMGHLLALDHGAPTLALTIDGLRRWHARARELPAAVEWSGAGTLWLGEDQAQLEQAFVAGAALAAAGVTVEHLDAADLRRLEPCLAPDLPGALRVADDRVIYPPAAAAWMLARARELGAQVITGVAVTAIDAEMAGERLLLADGRRLLATRVVVAAGLATTRLLSSLLPGTARPIQPRRGHLLITDRSTLGLRHQLVELGYHASVHDRAGARVAFNLQPRRGGQLLLGSSREDLEDRGACAESAQRDVDRNVLARMVARGLRFVPALADQLALRAWVGLRPATGDGLPLIGPLPGRPSLLLAAGHEGLGVTTATSTAALIAADLGVAEVPPGLVDVRADFLPSPQRLAGSTPETAGIHAA